MGTHYKTNWVVCLADNLMSSAKVIQLKALQPEPGKIKQGKTLATKYPIIPSTLPLYSSSRITILGHGDPASTEISGNGIRWTPEQCAEVVARWCRRLKVKKVRRISFHMCFGASPEGEKGSYHSSFVHKFASYCDFADEVVGRTDKTRMNYKTETTKNGTTGKETKAFLQGFRTVGGKYKDADGKILFKPNGGTISLPKSPTAYRYCYE